MAALTRFRQVAAMPYVAKGTHSDRHPRIRTFGYPLISDRNSWGCSVRPQHLLRLDSPSTLHAGENSLGCNVRPPSALGHKCLTARNQEG